MLIFATLGQCGLYTEPNQQAAQRLVVNGFVGNDPLGLLLGTTGFAGHGRHVDDERQHRRAVVLVRGNRLYDQRHSAGVRQPAVLTARAAAIRRIRTSGHVPRIEGGGRPSLLDWRVESCSTMN